MSKADELIACLEGEIAKRDARILELESDLAGTQSRVLSLQDQWRKLDAELAAIKAQEPVAVIHEQHGFGWYKGKKPAPGTKLYAAPVSDANAQGVVMPDTEDFCFCGKHVSLQMISGGASNHGYLGSVTLLIDGEYVEYTRLNAAPVQQVSVPASAFASRAIAHYEAALLAAFPSGSSGEVFNQWNEARRVLAAAPAAPAADAPVRQATDGGRNQSYEGLFDGETEEQRASRLAAHHAKGGGVMAVAEIRGKTVECKCERCKQPFIARVADRKRGWARFCSKSCKAIKQASAQPSAKVAQTGCTNKKKPPAWIAGMLAGRSKMFDPRRHRFEEDDAEEFSDAHLFSNEDHDCNKDL